MMFSATKTEKTEALTKLALKKQPVYVGVDDSKESATVEGLEQGNVFVTFWFLPSWLFCKFFSFRRLRNLSLG